MTAEHLTKIVNGALTGIASEKFNLDHLRFVIYALASFKDKLKADDLTKIVNGALKGIADEKFNLKYPHVIYALASFKDKLTDEYLTKIVNAALTGIASEKFNLDHLPFVIEALDTLIEESNLKSTEIYFNKLLISVLTKYSNHINDESLNDHLSKILSKLESIIVERQGSQEEVLKTRLQILLKNTLAQQTTERKISLALITINDIAENFNLPKIDSKKQIYGAWTVTIPNGAGSINFIIISTDDNVYCLTNKKLNEKFKESVDIFNKTLNEKFKESVDIFNKTLNDTFNKMLNDYKTLLKFYLKGDLDLETSFNIIEKIDAISEQNIKTTQEIETFIQNNPGMKEEINTLARKYFGEDKTYNLTLQDIQSVLRVILDDLKTGYNNAFDILIEAFIQNTYNSRVESIEEINSKKALMPAKCISSYFV